jgi:hypothetical protein
MSVEPVTQPEIVALRKSDLIEAWSILERLVVSLHKIGSHHATPSSDVPMTPQQRESFLAALEDFFGPDFFREAARARRALSQYIPDEEGEAISDSLKYWEPK